MTTAWIPTNWEDICKRNAGRRKLHMRKRRERASRILRLLAAMESAPELRESAYGCLTRASQAMEISRATASRDFALARRIHVQFARMFGRTLRPESDQVIWSWDWAYYGFRTPESVRAGFRKGVGRFPFGLRENGSEEDYSGLSPVSFIEPPTEDIEDMDVLSLIKLAGRASQLSNSLRRRTRF